MRGYGWEKETGLVPRREWPLLCGINLHQRAGKTDSPFKSLRGGCYFFQLEGSRRVTPARFVPLDGGKILW